MRSLKARLNLGLVVSLVALFSVQWWVVSASVRGLTEKFASSRLEHDTESLLVALKFDAQGNPRLDPRFINPVFNRPFSGHYFHIISGAHQLRSRSLWDQDLPLTPAKTGEVAVHTVAGPQNEALLMRVGGYRKRGHEVTLAVAEDYSVVEHELGEFQLHYVLISLLILTVLIGLQAWVLTRALRPLDDLRGEMARLERGEVGALKGEVPTEVSPLVREINRLLEVMTDRQRRSRNALGNLAHAVKTPLTVLNQLIQSDELADRPRVRDQLQARADDIRHYVERELKRARVAGAAAPGQQFVPAAELPSLIDALTCIFSEKKLAIESHVPPAVRFMGEREDMLELFGNLLDNACKWARGNVLLHVDNGPGLKFSVEDDGPGVPDEKLRALSARGVRIDEEVDGYGLGLAIVHDIVRQYGGRIEFGRSAGLGGFRVSVALPAGH